MNKKHTPGPWAIYNTTHNSCTIEGREDGRNSTMHIGMPVPVGNYEFNGKEFQANARLITAAPEMLESLKELEAEIDVNMRASFQKGKMHKAIEEMLARAQVAIAKAGGSE